MEAECPAYLTADSDTCLDWLVCDDPDREETEWKIIIFAIDKLYQRELIKEQKLKWPRTASVGCRLRKAFPAERTYPEHYSGFV